jgi:periplasmic copper chaperone A
VKRPLLAAAAAVIAVAGCGGGSSSARIEATDAWARTTPPGVSVGVVYMEVTSSAADALVGASVDPSIAAKVELHTNTTSGDMSSMQPVASMPVAPDAAIELDPLGSHLMLVDLAGPLTKGERFDVTLHFRTAGDDQVSVEVRDEAP